MITFKKYLLEGDGDELSIQQAVEIYRTKCGDWKDPEKPLHRRTTNREAPTERSTRERLKTRSGNDAIQKWVFSTPGWETFPDRRTSIFCSTTNNTALGSTNAFLYPFAGTKMAITDDIDFNLIRVGDFALKTIAITIKDIWEDAFLKRPTEDIGSMWKDLVARFTEDGELDKDALDGASLSRYSKNDFELFFKILPAAFAPKKMGVTLTTPKTIKFDGDAHEVWFTGKYLSLPDIMFDEFVNAVKT